MEDLRALLPFSRKLLPGNRAPVARVAMFLPHLPGCRYRGVMLDRKNCEFSFTISQAVESG